MSRLLIALTAALLCLSAGPMDQDSAKKDEDPKIGLSEVTMYRNPPGLVIKHRKDKPAEEVLLRQGPHRRAPRAEYHVIVNINVSRRTCERYTEQVGALTKREWEALERLIADKKLIEWEPQSPEEMSMDFGELGFTIRASAGSNSHVLKGTVQVWNAVRALLLHVGRLANSKVRGARLLYF